MKQSQFILLLCFLYTSLLSCNGQKSFGSNELTLRKSISMPHVKGRIDHLDANVKDQMVYVAALGNNSLEVIDLKNGKLLHSIGGLDEPQGVAYVPQTKEIIVANGGNGECKFYNAKTFENTASIDLGSDADDVRYDSADQKIFVGYGEGGIAIIDAVKHEKIADIKLPAHPEGFQLDKRLNRLFVNVPDAGEIDVIDLKELKLTHKWKTEYRANFPMAIDESKQIIFVGYRHPGKLVAINSTTGNTIAVADLISDIDDLYFDTGTKKIYASGGGGAINIYSFNNSEIIQVANIPTRNGARTSLLLSQLSEFVLAERAGGEPAQLQVFSTRN
jgi:DNA-binding beta-propeller fold protein YncE